MTDFRAQRMPSPEGRGVARRAWDRAWGAYRSTATPVLRPIIEPMARPVANSAAYDLVGFWVAWHMYGGFEGLQEHMHMSRSAIYRRVNLFRKLFGEHPDTYQMPGVALDVRAYHQRKPYGWTPGDDEAQADAPVVEAVTPTE